MGLVFGGYRLNKNKGSIGRPWKLPSKLLAVAATALLASACGKGGGNSTPTPPAPALEMPSVAAFADVPPTVLSYSTVALDGTSSTKAASALSYRWSQLSGPTVTLATADAAISTFTAPNVSSPTPFGFQLVVKDAAGTESTAAVTLTVMPASTEQLTPTFVSLRLYKAHDGSGHTDSYETDGPPLIGSSLLIKAALSGAVATPTFSLIDANGNVIGSISMVATSRPEAQPLTFGASFTVPSVPFRIQAQGTSSDGQNYLLKSPTLIAPMNMEISFSPQELVMARSTSATPSLEIANGGPAATFNIQFSDPSGLLTGPASMTVSVAQGETKALSIPVTFPPSPSETVPTLTATASVSGDPLRQGTAGLMVFPDSAP